VRVAVLTKHFPNSHQQWAGHSAYQTIRVLATLCDLHVFYPETAYPALLTPRSSRRPPLDRTWSPAGVNVSYLPFPVLPVISRSLNGAMIAHRLLPHVRRFNPDILLSYFIYPDGYAAVRIGRALGIPTVVTAVGSDINRIPDPVGRMLTSSTLRNAAFVSTVSEDLRVKAIALGADPARTRTKLNGCDTTVFYPRDRCEARQALNIGPDAKAIVYVGRLDLRKGLMELVDAVGQLIPQNPDLRCYIVGDGPDKPALLAAIGRHDAAAQISIVPACPTAQVALWMAAADLVTLPSYNEGCPNVVVEALAAGRPVVATNVGGIPELMDDTCGRLVPPRDTLALARALDEVLAQTWSAETISSRRGRAWTDVAQDLYSVLEESLARNDKGRANRR
jgi:teichuronic acid biosynthesis glycosyltransferase TuaC